MECYPRDPSSRSAGLEQTRTLSYAFEVLFVLHFNQSFTEVAMLTSLPIDPGPSATSSLIRTLRHICMMRLASGALIRALLWKAVRRGKREGLRGAEIPCIGGEDIAGRRWSEAG